MEQQTKDLITNEISNNEVCLFMKGTPDAPQCGFSMAISNMLKILEVNFKGINVLENEELRQGIKQFSDWPTIPQLYIKKEFVGGCDIVKEMYENGELKKILEVNYKGINVLESQSLREGIKEFSDWPTIPQVYIKGEFVGGCDIVKEMYENGELKKIFEEKAINHKKD
jgi:monothiol glutaredoxin